MELNLRVGVACCEQHIVRQDEGKDADLDPDRTRTTHFRECSDFALVHCNQYVIVAVIVSTKFPGLVVWPPGMCP